MDILMKNIETLGKECVENHLSSVQKELEIQDEIDLNNWIDSVRYYFYHTFMRGRRDNLSIRYCKYALHIIETQIGLKFEDLKKAKIGTDNDIDNLFCSTFTIDKKKTYLNNQKDRILVLSSFDFMKRTHDGNIISYLLSNISNLKLCYDQLKSVKQVGDKIASFLLRNIILSKQIYIDKGNYEYVLPIDTWIDKICIKIGIYNGKIGGIKKKREEMICKCKEYKVDPLYFNQGLWYLGFNSLDISIELLKKNEYSKVKNKG